MSLLDEFALRTLIAEEVRRVLREEFTRSPERDEYLPVAEAARVAAVAPETMRGWIHQGRLHECWAGRELRVRRSELQLLLSTPPPKGAAEPSPEEEARRFLSRRETVAEPRSKRQT